VWSAAPFAGLQAATVLQPLERKIDRSTAGGINIGMVCVKVEVVGFKLRTSNVHGISGCAAGGQ
jgi:hypothetical protein